MVLGKCLFTLDVLMAGHVLKLLFLMAANHVDLTGLKHAPCKNLRWSLMQWRTFIIALICGGVLKEGSNVHRPLGERLPRRTSWPWYWMIAASLVNCAVHP